MAARISWVRSSLDAHLSLLIARTLVPPVLAAYSRCTGLAMNERPVRDSSQAHFRASAAHSSVGLPGFSFRRRHKVFRFSLLALLCSNGRMRGALRSYAANRDAVDPDDPSRRRSVVRRENLSCVCEPNRFDYKVKWPRVDL